MRQRNKRHHHHQIASEQIDLFQSPDSGTRRQPAWETLPPHTRTALTDLMTRLMLDHKNDRQDLGTRETRHES